MLTVPLSKGFSAQIDESDSWILSGNKWVASKNGTGVYAVRNSGTKRVYMHRMIMNAQDGQLVDHVNSDTLDNRRLNLRICTKQQNAFNMKPRATGHKGVSFLHGKWKARLMFNKKTVSLGSHNTFAEATRAYDVAAERLFGEFARTNA